jgi:NAD+ diphosphatase
MALGGMTGPVPLGFTGLTLDRADNLRLDPAKIAALAAQPGAQLMGLEGMAPRLAEDGRLAWEALAGAPTDTDKLLFLGLADETPLFAPIAPVETDGWQPHVFAMLGTMAPEDASLWGVARSLIAWHGRHGFCSNCGARTEPFRAGWARRCASCSVEHFPRVDPVVIMLAEHDGKVLVGRHTRFPPRSYSALAGYAEHGEAIEEAVARELKEEAGVIASNVRYLASQPWPFSGALMIACLAEAESDRIEIDPAELEAAMWVGRDGVAAALAYEPSAPFVPPPHYAIAHSLMRLWLNRA